MSMPEEQLSPQAQPQAQVQMHSHSHPDWFGAGVGILVFFFGIALLVLVFRLAYDLFTVPPSSALGLQKGKELDLAKAGDSAASLILKIVLLIVMAFVGSAVANRGISLYTSARKRELH